MKMLVVIQARTGSSRLPRKVMLPLAGAPLLVRMVERVASARSEFEIVVATTTDSQDEPIRGLCRERGLDCFSGHPTDLLDRHYQAALQRKADVVLKIPSDCPLIDPAVIDRVIEFFNKHKGQSDYVSNLHPATYPDGNDVEVFTMEALEAAWCSASRLFEREHTTPFIWERPRRFRIGNVEWESGLNCAMSHRWTIDYPDDYRFIARVYEELWSEYAPFSINEILELLSRRPDIHALNARYAGVNWYRHHLSELRTVTPEQTRVIVPAA